MRLSQQVLTLVRYPTTVSDVEMGIRIFVIGKAYIRVWQNTLDQIIDRVGNEIRRQT